MNTPVFNPHRMLRGFWALMLLTPIPVILGVTDTNMANADSPGWIVQCNFARSLADDPIVFPTMKGVSHMHDFIGNGSIDANSTYGTAISGITNCAEPSDTAGYWVPALYRNGVKIAPVGGIYTGNWKTRQRIYYRDSNLDEGTPVRSFPPDFRILAGNGHAMSPAENPKLGSSIYWGCADNSTGKLKLPPASCSVGAISLHVGFPNCWDGQNIDSADHKTHVVYPSGGECPSDHPVALPRVIVRLEYPVGRDTGNITLSSGPPYTIHGDFWNTWRQPRLDELVAGCLNADEDCGLFK